MLVFCATWYWQVRLRRFLTYRREWIHACVAALDIDHVFWGHTSEEKEDFFPFLNPCKELCSPPVEPLAGWLCCFVSCRERDIKSADNES